MAKEEGRTASVGGTDMENFHLFLYRAGDSITECTVARIETGLRMVRADRTVHVFRIQSNAAGRVRKGAYCYVGHLYTARQILSLFPRVDDLIQRGLEPALHVSGPSLDRPFMVQHLDGDYSRVVATTLLYNPLRRIFSYIGKYGQVAPVKNLAL